MYSAQHAPSSKRRQGLTVPLCVYRPLSFAALLAILQQDALHPKRATLGELGGDEIRRPNPVLAGMIWYDSGVAVDGAVPKARAGTVRTYLFVYCSALFLTHHVFLRVGGLWSATIVWLPSDPSAVFDCSLIVERFPSSPNCDSVPEFLTG